MPLASSPAREIIATLKAHEPELRAAGIDHLSLFGSTARGDSTRASDIDIAVVLNPAHRIDLFKLTALERRLADLLGRPVDLLPEPVEKLRLQASIDRDRQRAF
jgi:predicted nucleotidyltransferase